MCIFHLIFAAVFFNATTALVHCCWRHCHCQHNFRHPFAVAPQWFPYIMSFEENYTVAACIKLLVFVQSKWMRFRMAERLQVKFRWHADFFVQQPPAKKRKVFVDTTLCAVRGLRKSDFSDPAWLFAADVVGEVFTANQKRIECKIEFSIFAESRGRAPSMPAKPTNKWHTERLPKIQFEWLIEKLH